MSDILSQDQLDQLLAQQDVDTTGAAGLGSEESEEGSGKNYKALSAAIEFFNEKAAGVIGNVLNRTSTLSIVKCDAIDAEMLKNSVAAPVFMVTIPFETGLEGSLYVLLASQHVARLADLMLMGDGSAEYNEDHKDALGELFNQITGAFASGLGQRMSVSVSMGVVQVQEFDFAAPPFSLKAADMALLHLSVAGFDNAPLGLILPDQLSTELMTAFAGAAAPGSAGAEGGKGVGLNSAELDDLSKVTSDLGGSSGGFKEVSARDSGFPAGPKENVQMLLDVELDVTIELGKADLSVKRILELAPGSIVELDRLAGEPVDLLVNKKVVAKGEVVVVDENFGIRIVSLVSPEERIKSLR
jgi:flagellar motor switch protein FliN